MPGLRTLIVEDDAEQRELFAGWLRELGLDVLALGDGDAALIAHLREPFDLVVLDWVLPSLDGLQLLRRIRGMSDGDRAYVLVVTGRDRPEDLTQVLDAGADDYLAKPVSQATIKTRIRIAARRVDREVRHRRAQAALARSEVDFHRVVERCPLGVFAHREGRVVYVNAAATRTLGRSREQLCGMHVCELVTEKYREPAARRTARFERSDVPPPPMEMEACRPGGTAVVRFIPATAADHPQGRACFTILEDITSQQRAARELQMTQFAMDHAADAAFWIAHSGQITYANHAACTLSGFNRDELLAMSIVELDASVPTDRWPTLRDELLAPGGMQRESVFVRRDGSRVPVEIFARPVDFDGERFVVAFTRNLTDRNTMQVSLQQADRLASVGALAAGVAHEINNPLAYVIANLELMAEELERGRIHSLEEFRGTLDEVQDGVHRVRRIVRDLKSFARSDDSEVATIDVEGVLNTAIDIVGNEIRHRATLQRDYVGLPPISANAGRLTQVFINLLVNAAHAIPEGSRAHTITVRTRETDDDHVEISVSDTGVGIPADLLDHIFDPFFTTKPLGQGTGLGLSICHGIITSMGGVLDVSSELGRGSTFLVRLPAVTSLETIVVDASAAANGNEGERSLRILVVDDEPFICDGIRRALPAHHVDVAKSGTEALDKVGAADFDLVLCDIMMPDLSGMEVYGRVLASHPGLQGRFVFMTGGAFTPNARAFLESIDNERIDKPFTLDELRALVAKRAMDASLRERA